MSRNNAEEALETFSSGLDDLVRKAVREYLAWERRNVHPGGLVLENIAERLKVGVASAHERVTELKCRDIRLCNGKSNVGMGIMVSSGRQGHTLHTIS
jgi:hypothetical protein